MSSPVQVFLDKIANTYGASIAQALRTQTARRDFEGSCDDSKHVTCACHVPSAPRMYETVLEGFIMLARSGTMPPAWVQRFPNSFMSQAAWRLTGVPGEVHAVEIERESDDPEYVSMRAPASALILTNADARKLHRLLAPPSDPRDEGRLGPNITVTLPDGASIRSGDLLLGGTADTIKWAFPGEIYEARATRDEVQKAERKYQKRFMVSAASEEPRIVYEWPDAGQGHWWVSKIDTPEELMLDGSVMDNCTRDDTYGHVSDLKSGDAKYFGLRFDDGEGGRRVMILKVRGKKGLEVRAAHNYVPGIYGDSMTERGRNEYDHMAVFLVEFGISAPGEMAPGLLQITKNTFSTAAFKEYANGLLHGARRNPRGEADEVLEPDVADQVAVLMQVYE